MKLGTIIKVKGRGIATVVYHNLDGYGIVWGRWRIDEKRIPEPDAMLKDSYPGCKYRCAGTNYVIIEEKLNDEEGTSEVDPVEPR